jgi:Tfp pilus assembly protein PilF
MPILPFALSLLILGAPAALPAQGVGREVSGFVRSAVTNQPIANAIVTLESSAGEMVQQMTPEGSGRFNFANLDGAIYYVVARAPGHRERRERADLVTYRRFSVQMILQADPTMAGAAAPVSAVVNQRLLRIPEAARKEFEKGHQQLTVKKDPQGSLPFFRKAVEKFPSFPEAWLLMGTAHMDLQEWKLALTALGRATQIDSKLAAAHMAMGTSYAQLGDLTGAEKSLLAGVALEPESSVAHWELARLYWTIKRIPEAEKHLDKILQLQPNFAAAHALRGNVRLARRDSEGALQSFKEYLRLEPQGSMAAAAQDAIRRIEEARKKP